MSDRPTFVAALRQVELDNAEERLRPGAVHRIARRLDAELLQQELPTRRRTWIPMVSFAAGAAMVLAVFTVGSSPEIAERQDPGPTPMHASWQVGGDNCHATHGETDIAFDGRCRVVAPDPGMVIESHETTRVQAVERGVALLDGAAIFDVEPRIEGPARRVLVPGGSIEVMGTRFSVVVAGDRGHVDLLEGSIHFVSTDGAVHKIAPGERFRFSSNPDITASRVEATPEAKPDALKTAHSEETAIPLAAGELLSALAEEPEDVQPSKPHASRARDDSHSPEALRNIVSQITDLRAKRQYRAAVSLLRGAIDDRGWDQHTREVLSYELGTILSTQLPDRDKACAHWTKHRQRFAEGRYARAIERAEDRLHCE